MHSLSNDREKQLMKEILDLLIPGNTVKNIPAAGELGVSSFIAEKIDNDDSLRMPIIGLLKHLDSMASIVTENAVRQLETDFPEDFTILLRLTYMGYYSRPDVRAFVGVGQWPVHPKGYDVPVDSETVMAELTEPVRARGSIFRNA